MKNNIFYLKRFRKKANKKIKLIQYKKDEYYVGRQLGLESGLYINVYEYHTSFDRAVKLLKEARRKYILELVRDKRWERERVVKGV